MDADSFIVHVKTDDTYEEIAEDIEITFYTSNCQFNRPLPKGKNKKVISVMKNELGGKNLREFVRLRAKTYYFLIDDGSEDKKSKRTKNVSQKENLNLKIINIV